jgi:hypothetical protein
VRLVALIADAHASFAREAPVTADQRNPVRVEPAHLRRIIEIMNHLVATCECRRDIQPPGDRLGAPRYTARLGENLGRPK